MIAADDSDEQEEWDDEGFFFREIGNADGKAWKEEIDVNGTKIQFKLDSGADVTVIGGSIYSRFFRQNKLERSRKKLFGIRSVCLSAPKKVGVIAADDSDEQEERDDEGFFL